MVERGGPGQEDPGVKGEIEKDLVKFQKFPGVFENAGNLSPRSEVASTVGWPSGPRR